jgi:putative endonuclease
LVDGGSDILAMTYHVYIMASRSKRLYVGVTNNLPRRVHQHKTGHFGGFTSRYNMTALVFYEQAGSPQSAIAREKQIKGWVRKRKLTLVQGQNPDWKDLSAAWFEPGFPF